MNSKIFYIFLFLFLESVYGQHPPVPVLDSSRRVDWSHAGLLPESPAIAYKFINVLDKGAVINDTIDDYQSILSAINEAKITPELSIIYFPAGRYIIDKPIVLEYTESPLFTGNMVFQGDGPETIWQFNVDKEHYCIQVSGATYDQTQVTMPITKGSEKISANDLANYNAGDWIIYRQFNFPVYDPWAIGCVGQISRIRQKVSNTEAILEDKASIDYASIDGRIDINLDKVKPLRNIGFEKLRIERNAAGHSETGTNIYFRFAVNCWIRGVEFYKTCQHHVEIDKSSHVEVSGCCFNDANYRGNGGYGYGVSIFCSSTNCLVENNIFRKLRHAMLVQAGANCNVFGYNYSIEQMWECGGGCADGRGADICIHGNYPYANLFESNCVTNIWLDASNGLNGPYNTLFRNKTHNEKEILVLNADCTNAIGNENATAITTDINFLKRWLYKVFAGWEFHDSHYLIDLYFHYYPDGPTWNSPSDVTHAQWNNDRRNRNRFNKLINKSFLNDISYYYKSEPGFNIAHHWPPQNPATNLDYNDQIEPSGDLIAAEERYAHSINTYISDPTTSHISVSGVLPSSQTWKYGVDFKGNVFVPPGVTLTILADSEINYNGYYLISTGGTITDKSGE